MIYFLGVYQPKHCFPIWLLRNLTDTMQIDQLNWSGYVLSVLAHAGNQVQLQLEKGCQHIQLYGCGFLLHVCIMKNDMYSSSAL